MGQDATQCAQREQRTRTNEATTPTANDASCVRCGTGIPIEDPECRHWPLCTRGTNDSQEAPPVTKLVPSRWACKRGIERCRYLDGTLCTEQIEILRKHTHAEANNQERRTWTILDGRSAMLSSVFTRTTHASICNNAISNHCL